MRKLLLITAIAITGLASNAQKMYDLSQQQGRMEESPVLIKDHGTPHPSSSNQGGNSRSVSTHTKLHSIRVGSAGNLLTVSFSNCNQLDVSNELNSVVFVHRNDETIFPGTNVAQYRYDGSRDGGHTWTPNIGPITRSNKIDNVYINGRFPQGGLYNPIGNTNPDSAIVVYAGTWHNDPGDGTGKWMGQMRGRGNFNDDPNTFNVHIDTVNGGKVGIASGFTQSIRGTFWNVNMDYDGNFSSINNTPITHGIVVEKGVWDSVSRDVKWTEFKIPQTFTTQNSGGVALSVVTSLNIAFDPTGQYGWIGCLGDITLDNDSAYEPIFWKSADYGVNWTGPIRVELNNMPEIKAQLHKTYSTGAGTNEGLPTSQRPATGFDEDMVVDYLGNPHMVVVVGNNENYSFLKGGGYTAWDITYNSNFPSCVSGFNGWKGIFLDSVQTFRGNLTTDGETQDNRPLASRSPDGKKVFFYWLDTDLDFTLTDQNDLPNMFTKGFDLPNYTSTPVINLTLGDTLWGGQTYDVPGGIFGGATFGTAGATAIKHDDSYTVPFILTQVDYNHDPLNGAGSYLKPAAFWYIDNITYDSYDFTEGLSATVTINGDPEVTLYRDSTYIDQGAFISYLDTNCYKSGPLHLVIDTSEVDVHTNGHYSIHYLAESEDGSIFAAASRSLVVGSAPEADFKIQNTLFTYKKQFIDLSKYEPTAWEWQFDANSGAHNQNPLKVFTANGDYHVCLISSNSFGSSTKVCKDLNITGVGINEIVFSQNISVFPNPTTGKVKLTLADNSLTDLSVSVVDLLGNEVVAAAKYAKGTTHIEMDLSALPSSLYLIKIASNEGSAVKQLNVINNH